MDIELSLTFFCFVSGNFGVKSRLSAAVDFWRSTLNAAEFVVDNITCGYSHPLGRYSPSCFLANNR